MKKYFIFQILISITFSIFSQNTLGVITNTEDAYNGYTLFTTHQKTYLINNCGEVINEWNSDYIDGKSVYLLEDGSILRAGVIPNSNFSLPGMGGIIEIISWSGDLLWSYTYSSESETQHHDIQPLPNGNILVLSATKKTLAEAFQAGRNSSLLEDDSLYNEQIIELEPNLTNGSTNIVWEWNIWDHLIQDDDINKANYGVVNTNPQLLDINYLGTSNKVANWLHFNSIQYNSELDQILISARHMNEIYIIDHSTTTVEASSHTGGNSNKGGDFLYRWGNPIAYRQGLTTDQKLFAQHTPYWIPTSYPNGGKILLFNNGVGRETEFSSVDIINPQKDGVYNYTYTSGSYGPNALDWTYQATNPTDFYSRIMSNAQRLPNGNTLICNADSGYFFEIDSGKNIVWEYISPQQTNGGVLSQGNEPVANRTFRAIKYPLDYPAFSGKDLTPGAPIELNSNLNVACSTLNTKSISFINDINIYPNPTTSKLNIISVQSIDMLELYSSNGLKVLTEINTDFIDLSGLASGIYFLRVKVNQQLITKKIIKK